MGAGVEWGGGFKIKCGSGLVCQTEFRAVKKSNSHVHAQPN